MGILKYPLLADYARKCMCIPASSAVSEREFKVAKRIDTPRPNLNKANLEMLIFLKYNLRALDYEEIKVNVPANWTSPNSSQMKTITQPEPQNTVQVQRPESGSECDEADDLSDESD